MSVENEDLDLGTPEEIEREARTLGWVPQDQFKGDGWVDAEEFVRRGQTLMPILRANNKRLQRELLTRDQKIDMLTRKLDGATTAIEKLEHHYTEANKRQLEDAQRQLKEQLKQAREDEDVDAEVQILDKLDEVRRAKDQTPQAKKTNQEEPTQPNADPETLAWTQENPWFGKDKKKTKLVTRIAEDLRDEGTDLTGRAFLDECMRLYEEQYGDPDTPPEPKQTRQVSKVEGSSSARRTPAASKSFDSLPADAKQACWDDVDNLVGPDKRYKTQKEWETAYAKIYYGS